MAVRCTPVSGRVVVCEDDPTARRIISSLLQHRGLDVIAELDMIPPLVDVVELGRPDAVVLDLVLAGMVGPESLNELEVLASAVSVVVFSAYDNLRDEALGR